MVILKNQPTRTHSFRLIRYELYEMEAAPAVCVTIRMS